MPEALEDLRIERIPPRTPPVPLPEIDEGPATFAKLLEFGALEAVVRSAGLLPAGAVRSLARGLGRLLPALDRRHARGARDFLRTAYPGASAAEVEQRVRAAYAHLIEVSLRADRLRERMLGQKVGDFFDLELCDEARELFERRGDGRGVLGLSAHLGWWELTGNVLEPVGLGPTYAIFKPPRNAWLTRSIVASRARMGASCVQKHGAMRVIPALLRAGGTLQLLVDQRSTRGWVEAPFFGRPANCDRTFSVLTRRVPQPVLVYACLGTEDPSRFRFVAPKVLDPGSFADLGPAEAAARVNEEVESLIRMAPDQYLWLHDRFRGRAPRAPSPGPSQATDDR